MIAKFNLSQSGRFVTFGIFCIFIASCEDLVDNKDKHFPLEERRKIKFQKGDTLTYRDQQGATFRLVITDILYDQRWTSRKGTNGPYNIIDRQSVYYDSADITSPAVPLPGSNIYTKQPDGHVTWEPDLYTIVGDDSPYYQETVTLNTRSFQSVFRLPARSVSKSGIITWYYSYAYGFVAFELNNGQIFSLDIP